MSKAPETSSGGPTLSEVRSITTEIRMVEKNGKPKICGYGAVFNSRSSVLEDDTGMQFREICAPGAFARALGECDMRGLFNHDKNLILGRMSSGTMQCREDDTGLYYEIDPPDTSYARDLMESIKRGDISGSSFSFAVVRDDWGTDSDGMALRTLRDVHPFDVGPVAFPAYKATSATMRSLQTFLEARKITYPTPAQVALLNQLRLAEI